MAVGEKMCLVCGKDVRELKRTKDAAGRYYCQPCYEEAMATTAAALASRAIPNQSSGRPPSVDAVAHSAPPPVQGVVPRALAPRQRSNTRPLVEQIPQTNKLRFRMGLEDAHAYVSEAFEKLGKLDPARTTPISVGGHIRKVLDKIRLRVDLTPEDDSTTVASVVANAMPFNANAGITAKRLAAQLCPSISATFKPAFVMSRRHAIIGAAIGAGAIAIMAVIGSLPSSDHQTTSGDKPGDGSNLPRIKVVDVLHGTPASSVQFSDWHTSFFSMKGTAVWTSGRFDDIFYTVRENGVVKDRSHLDVPGGVWKKGEPTEVEVSLPSGDHKNVEVTIEIAE